jgi:hypothetical protein
VKRARRQKDEIIEHIKEWKRRMRDDESNAKAGLHESRIHSLKAPGFNPLNL